MADVLERLDRYAALKPGDPHPDWLPVNGWGPVVNADMAAAAAEIRRPHSARPAPAARS